MSDVKIKNNKAEVESELAFAILRGLKAIGEVAETHAKKDCPVDSGRLRNSITYAIRGYHGPMTTEAGRDGQITIPDSSEYETHGEPDEDTLVIGTNVVYAPPQEFNERYAHVSGKAHFLRDAISTHGDQYKKIMEASLKAK